MKILLFNPFKYVAGLKALLIGLIAMLITAVVAFFSKTHFDGVIDTHTGLKAPFCVYLLDQLNAWGCAVLLFYIAARIFSKSAIRFIDFAGTLALARWPMIFTAIISFGVNVSKPIVTASDISISMIVIAFVSIIFSIWMIALSYNAFRISSNLKKETAIGAFIGAIILAEILSHFFSYEIYKHLI